MIVWLIKSIGIGDEMLQHLDKVRVAFQHPFLLWAGMILLIPIGVFIFRRQARNLGGIPPWVLAALTATRVAILALMVLVLSGPYLKLDYERKKKPVVAMLFDTSQSMHLPAGPFETDRDVLRAAEAAGYDTRDGKVDPDVRKALNRISRIKLGETVVQTAGPKLFKPLAERFDLRFYAFDADVRAMAVNPEAPTFPEPPNPGGSATRIGDAIGRVLDEAGGNPVAGVLLFSDGQNTGGQAPAEIARRAVHLGIPIYAVQAGSTAAVHDVSVMDVNTSGEVALGDTAQVGVTVESRGLEGKTVTVQLVDGEAVLDSRDLVLRGSEQQQVELKFEATRPGSRYLKVHIPALPEEPDYLRMNNSDSAFVRVSRERIRVLYMEGLPRWDFRFLKNAMRRDRGLGGRTGTGPDILLEAEMRRRPAEQAAPAIPATVEELAPYHAVILGDVSPRIFQPQVQRALAEAVRDRGLGLIVQAGPLYMPHVYDERVNSLLPVGLHPKAAGMEAPVYRPFRLEITPQGAIHETMRLYDEDERNRNIWAGMPTYYWCAAAERAAPGATVLAWNPDVGARHGNVPLIACQFAGQGKVMFVGTDATWLWRRNVGDRFFYRFWGQAIRFVARRDDAGRRDSSLEVWPIRAQPGHPAQIQLTAYGEDGSPRSENRQTVSVMFGKRVQSVQLIADPIRRGVYSGQFVPEATGDYYLAFDPGDTTGLVSARIHVMAAAEEMRSPGINRTVLETLAIASGGQVLDLAELGTVPQLLKGEVQTTPVHREAALWDNWLMLVLIVLIYSVDVGLRRLRGLS